MKTRRRLVCIAGFVFLSLYTKVFAGTTEQNEAIRNFAFQGMRFGTSVEVFRQKFPEANVESKIDDPEKGLNVFSLDNVSGVDIAYFFFHDKTLYQIVLFYFPSTTNKIGGWDVVEQRIVNNYGKADADSKGTNVKEENEIANYFWQFPEVDRVIELEVTGKLTEAIFTDMVGFKRMKERKKEGANLGF